ncbi:tryptophan 7-halogenase [Sphingomonas sabuli]|uniref:Tryptophan 7-halogenase n=2 Tax=Sphingomonas sabuli TaxID=2764186 RepID=A0A7G9L5Z3_9SPHN|nr:tryptophan 7-halogenase [Sphingomonas sabuli]
MEPQAPITITIVGGGTAGWMTAAALGRFLGKQASITLVESDDIGTVGVGEATIPHIKIFNDALGIDEAEFVAATGATYKLGIAFEGWGAPDDAYVHAFGQVGRGIGLLPFHQFWLRGRNLGVAKPLGHYILNTIVLAGNRFAHVEREPGNPLPPIPYAFHFDAGLYARFLRGFAERHGVTRVEGKIVAVSRDPSNGDIAALTLADGTQVGGHLFIDCSGFRGLLIEQELEAGFEDWTRWLPCDRACAVPSESTDPLTPYTRAMAHPAGWQWRIPLQHRTGNGIVYSSAFLDDQRAADRLVANLDGRPLADPRTLRFTTGRRARAWVRNVVAIGLSAGFIEPLESTSIHLIQTAINRLLELVPRWPIHAGARDDYNARTAREMEAVRDFIILHYHANGRTGEPFWDGLRTMPIPDSLAHRIELFRSDAAIFPGNDELFDQRGWVQVLIGQGVVPERYHPIADELPESELRRFLDLTEQAYVQDASRIPDHRAYVQKFAPMRREEETA